MIFTEFMPNPDVNTDSTGEWFELYNTTEKPLELSGLTLADISSSEIISPDQSLVIEPMSYLVFAKSEAYGGGTPAAWIFSTISLNNTGDTITIKEELNGDIDSVDYTGGSFSAGVAMQLSPASLDAASNDGMEQWCEAVTDQGNGDLGSPGDENAPCEISGP